MFATGQRATNEPMNKSDIYITPPFKRYLYFISRTKKFRIIEYHQQNLRSNLMLEVVLVICAAFKKLDY